MGLEAIVGLEMRARVAFRPSIRFPSTIKFTLFSNSTASLYCTRSCFVCNLSITTPDFPRVGSISAFPLIHKQTKRSYQADGSTGRNTPSFTHTSTKSDPFAIWCAGEREGDGPRGIGRCIGRTRRETPPAPPACTGRHPRRLRQRARILLRKTARFHLAFSSMCK